MRDGVKVLEIESSCQPSAKYAISLIPTRFFEIASHRHRTMGFARVPSSFLPRHTHAMSLFCDAMIYRLVNRQESVQTLQETFENIGDINLVRTVTEISVRLLQAPEKRCFSSDIVFFRDN